MSDLYCINVVYDTTCLHIYTYILHAAYWSVIIKFSICYKLAYVHVAACAKVPCSHLVFMFCSMPWCSRHLPFTTWPSRDLFRCTLLCGAPRTRRWVNPSRSCTSHKSLVSSVWVRDMLSCCPKTVDKQLSCLLKLHAVVGSWEWFNNTCIVA